MREFAASRGCDFRVIVKRIPISSSLFMGDFIFVFYMRENLIYKVVLKYLFFLMLIKRHATEIVTHDV